jgi:NAD(P)-dependent dehydrogenase (short-subunit alcohol dehydrogenase family)
MAAPSIAEHGEAAIWSGAALERLTEPDDVAPTILFLASGLADHATGTTVDINAASYVR